MIFELIGSTLLYVNSVLFGNSTLDPAVVERYVGLANYTYGQVLEIIELNTTQIVLNTTDGDLIIKADHDTMGTVFIAEMELDIDPYEFFYAMWYNAEDTPDWNPSISGISVLMDINNQTRISYQEVGSVGNGFLSSRDFVNLNSFREIDGTYYITFQSITFPEKAVPSGWVRGWNGPSGFSIEPSGNGSFVSWIFNTDMKMRWMPKSIMDSMFPTIVEGYLRNLRNYVDTLTNATTNAIGD